MSMVAAASGVSGVSGARASRGSRAGWGLAGRRLGPSPIGAWGPLLIGASRPSPPERLRCQVLAASCVSSTAGGPAVGCDLGQHGPHGHRLSLGRVIFTTVPATGEGTSASTLSVEISTSVSSALT